MSDDKLAYRIGKLERAFWLTVIALVSIYLLDRPRPDPDPRRYRHLIEVAVTNIYIVEHPAPAGSRGDPAFDAWDDGVSTFHNKVMEGFDEAMGWR